MRLVAAFDRYWFAPAPARRLAFLRILSGGFALGFLTLRYPTFLAPMSFERRQFVPTGIVKLLLDRPLPGELVLVAYWCAVAAGVPFVLGLCYRVTGPLFALLLLWVTSYRNSWSMLFHTENLLVLHVILLAAAPAADALSLDARGRAAPPASGAFGWPARAMSTVTAVCYVLAGLAKLKLSGTVWLEGGLLRAQIAYDNLRKIELGSDYSALGAALVHYEKPFVVLALMTMVLELGAPIALFGRRLAFGWVVIAFGFHVGVQALMAIPFPYQLSLFAYASFFEIERVADFVVERARRLLAHAPRAGSPST